MNNSMMNGIASIFTGKGAIKLAIAGSLIAAVIYEIIDANYGLDVAMRDGSISLITVTGSSDQRMQTNSIQESEQSEQDQMQTSVTDNQEEDEQKG